MDTLRNKNGKGFTLVEMAVVVLLFGLMMSMGLKMVTATLENTAHSETVAKQERIKQALIAFMRANGRLPCPDNPALNTPAGIANGEAQPTCNNTAALGYGVVPWVTLGLPREAAQDGWGNLFTYRVANRNETTPVSASWSRHINSNQNWTSRSSSSPFDIRSLNAAAPTASGYESLRIIDASKPTPEPESGTAVVVILSHGKNGFGARTIRSNQRIPTIDAVQPEIDNADVNIREFVRRPGSNHASFDDIVAYMTPRDLLEPLMQEGALHSCRKYCRESETQIPEPPLPPPSFCNAEGVPVGQAAFTCPLS